MSCRVVFLRASSGWEGGAQVFCQDSSAQMSYGTISVGCGSVTQCKYTDATAACMFSFPFGKSWTETWETLNSRTSKCVHSLVIWKLKKWAYSKLSWDITRQLNHGVLAIVRQPCRHLAVPPRQQRLPEVGLCWYSWVRAAEGKALLVTCCRWKVRKWDRKAAELEF